MGTTLLGTARAGCVLAALLVTSAPCGATKTWLRNTDWANAGNWEGGRLPCGRDRAVLPAWLTAAVRLPAGDTAVRELLLPASGELLLPATGALLFTADDHAAPDCPGQDAVFSRTQPAAWLDERNWRQEASAAAALAAGALPHLERVPCMLERAVFPQGSSFLVHLPEVPVGVGFLQIDGEEVDQEAWLSLLESEPGRRQFRSPEGWLAEAVSVGGEACHLPTGCPCQRPMALPAVCRHAEPCQTDLPCLQPVTPRGHCCPICGAYLLLDVELGTFWLQRLRRTLARALPAGVVPWASIVDLDVDSLVVQVVLADSRGHEGTSADAAQDLAATLLAERDLGVVGASVHASGPELRGGAVLALLGFMVGALAAVLLLMAGLFFLFVYRHGQTLQGDRRPFVFARFENTDQEDSHVSVVAPQPPPPEKAFHNPMYGKGAAQGGGDVSQEERQAALSAPATYTELQSRVDTQELVDVDIDDAPANVSSDV